MSHQAIAGTVIGGPYSPGILAEGRLVFISGQGPLLDGVRAYGSIKEETRLTLDNVGRVLAAAGATFADVVRCGVYLADLTDFAAMNQVYETYFAEPYPARTTIGSGLLQEMRIEIDCIAVLQGS